MEPPRILDPDQISQQQRVFHELVQVLRQREAILLVGSGCSMPMYPSWSQLIDDLAALASDCIPGGYILPSHIEGELEQLQHIRDACESHQDEHKCLDKIHQKLIRLFHEPKGGPSRIHDILVELPFRGYLTTNYDRLMERALGNPDGYGAIDVQTAEPLFLSQAVRSIVSPGDPKKVIHLHGTGEHPRRMVLTTSDYRRAYGLGHPDGQKAHHGTRPPQARRLLSALLMTRQVVFVGFGLNDPFLMRILKDVTAAGWEWDSPIHFAIMPLDEGNAAEQLEAAVLYRKEYGVALLFYEVVGNDHSRLNDKLEELAGALRGARPPLGGVIPEGGSDPEGSGREADEDGSTQPAAQLYKMTRTSIQENLRWVEAPDNEA